SIWRIWWPRYRGNAFHIASRPYVAWRYAFPLPGVVRRRLIAAIVEAAGEEAGHPLAMVLTAEQIQDSTGSRCRHPAPTNPRAGRRRTGSASAPPSQAT